MGGFSVQGQPQRQTVHAAICMKHPGPRKFYQTGSKNCLFHPDEDFRLTVT